MYFQVCNYSFIYINMKYIQQLDITDCGAACIAMIASHYGSKLSISEIRSTAGAAAGAAIGFAATKSSYVAAGCAVVAGAVSSEEGFRQDCVCIIIPLEKIQAEINKRK